jgi:hypothetical protein
MLAFFSEDPVLSQHVPEGTEETTENICLRVAGILDEIRTWRLSSTSQ